MALTYSQTGKLGSIAPSFQLRGTDGKTYGLKDFEDAKAFVVVFMCNHCPYVIATQDRINELAREYKERGVKLVGINSNDSIKYPDDSFAAMKIRAKEKNFAFPYLFDETQDVARAYGAVCTPEFYVYSRNAGSTSANQWKLSYLGRLDDSWQTAASVRRRDLALALDAILQGVEPDPDQKPAMGCSIKWKPTQP